MEAKWKATGKAPKALETKPELFLDLIPVWDSFWLLAGSRSLSMGAIGPIPLSEIRAYIDLFGTSGIDLRSFIVLLMAADDEYLQSVRKSGG